MVFLYCTILLNNFALFNTLMADWCLKQTHLLHLQVNFTCGIYIVSMSQHVECYVVFSTFYDSNLNLSFKCVFLKKL